MFRERLLLLIDPYFQKKTLFFILCDFLKPNHSSDLRSSKNWKGEHLNILRYPRISRKVKISLDLSDLYIYKHVTRDMSIRISRIVQITLQLQITLQFQMSRIVSKF